MHRRAHLRIPYFATSSQYRPITNCVIGQWIDHHPRRHLQGCISALYSYYAPSPRQVYNTLYPIDSCSLLVGEEMIGVRWLQQIWIMYASKAHINSWIREAGITGESRLYIPIFWDSHKSWSQNADDSFCCHRKSLAVLGGDPWAWLDFVAMSMLKRLKRSRSSSHTFINHFSARTCNLTWEISPYDTQDLHRWAMWHGCQLLSIQCPGFQWRVAMSKAQTSHQAEGPKANMLVASSKFEAGSLACIVDIGQGCSRSSRGGASPTGEGADDQSVHQ